MIKALMHTTAGERIVLLGLSAENMTRLMADEPIPIDLADLDLPRQRIIIVGAATEEAITESLRAYLGPNTQFR